MMPGKPQGAWQVSELGRDVLKACFGTVNQETGGRVAWNMEN